MRTPATPTAHTSQVSRPALRHWPIPASRNSHPDDPLISPARITGSRASARAWSFARDEAGRTRLDAFAREEAVVGLEGVPEGSHGPIERGGTRVHTLDGKDLTVARRKCDLQRDGDTLHVELHENLLAEVKQNARAADLLGRGALEPGRLPFRGIRDLDAPDEAASCAFDDDVLCRHAGEGGPPARTLRVRARPGRHRCEG